MSQDLPSVSRFVPNLVEISFNFEFFFGITLIVQTEDSFDTSLVVLGFEVSFHTSCLAENFQVFFDISLVEYFAFLDTVDLLVNLIECFVFLGI
jgi:hypothetical protein